MNSTTAPASRTSNRAALAARIRQLAAPTAAGLRASATVPLFTYQLSLEMCGNRCDATDGCAAIYTTVTYEPVEGMFLADLREQFAWLATWCENIENKLTAIDEAFPTGARAMLDVADVLDDADEAITLLARGYAMDTIPNGYLPTGLTSTHEQDDEHQIPTTFAHRLSDLLIAYCRNV